MAKRNIGFWKDALGSSVPKGLLALRPGRSGIAAATSVGGVSMSLEFLRSRVGSHEFRHTLVSASVTTWWMNPL
jgi:hypothetical protein